MNQEQTNITTGKQIRHLRTQLGMTQEELAGELNVTRQALSNWERDVNEPDLNMLKKICFLFGVNMDDFAKEVITKMETYEKKEKRQFNKYDMAIGLFYGVGIFLGIGIFFVGGFMTMSGAGWSPEISDVTGNVTYTAQFNSTAKTYTITYKVDGEVYDTKSVSYGNSITLPDAPTREGYTFSGWQTSYTTMPASNIEITGTFAINTYAVTYMVDGVQYGDSLTVDHGTKLTAPTAPAKNGAIFLGWTADGVNAYDFETPVTAETTLTAMWLDASGFITFSEGYAVTDDTYNGTDRDYVGFRFDVNMDNSNYTVVQHGILYGMNIATFSDGKADANLRFTDEEATALMDKVREFAAQNTDTETTDWIEVYIGDRRDGVVYARGFIIVTDGTNNYLIYSDVQEGSYNSFSE